MDNNIHKRRESDKDLDLLCMLLFFLSEIQSNLKFKNDLNFIQIFKNQDNIKDNNLMMNSHKLQ